MRRQARILGTALALAGAACAGGGGGSGPVSPPTPSMPSPPAPPPPPSPPPPPPPPPASFFENNEYSRDYSKALINASAAYAAGGTGEGVVIAVIDSGIDTTHTEFAGRFLEPESIDIYDGVNGYFTPPGASVVRDHLDDQQGHGTGVASLAGAAKLPEGDPLLTSFPSGMHGVAFDAQLLVIRADDSDPACAPNCEFDTRAIAAGIRYATDYAKANDVPMIINMSLGGDSATDAGLLSAMQYAVNNGVILVAAAGNDSRPEVDSPASFAASPTSRGLAIAVGAVNENRQITFSNRAGAAQDAYVAAPGENVVVAFPVDVAVAENPDSPCAGASTCYRLGVGTSFATPQVAGALALLLDAFPMLTPEEAVEILLTTAADLGAEGPDPVYGRGLVDLAAAFSPLGAVSLSFGRGAAVAPIELVNAAPAGATGDWITASGLLDGAIVRDSYRRAFTIDPEPPPAASALDAVFETAATSQRLDARRASVAMGASSFAFAAFRAPDDLYVAHANLVTDEMLTPELSFAVRHGRLAFAMGRGFSAPAPVGGPSAATLTPAAQTGAVASLTSAGDWASVSYGMGRWSLGVRAAGDEVRGFSAASLTRRFGDHQAGLEIGSAREEGAALGGAAGSRLGGADAADSAFAALAWRGPLRGGWVGSARVEGAKAEIRMPSFVHVEESPIASAWTVSLERPLSRRIDLGVTLAQPLRAESGSVALAVPVGVTEVNASIYEERTAALTPSGREIDLETALRFDLGEGGEGRVALRLASEPGHVADAEPEAALWIGMRWAG